MADRRPVRVDVKTAISEAPGEEEGGRVEAATAAEEDSAAESTESAIWKERDEFEWLLTEVIERVGGEWREVVYLVGWVTRRIC